ncbi:MAG: DUF1361 domain-containing protein [Parafilimonas sp.]|nr:DUF1361 domain-containing protein [Parafilimonas sp.]
MNSHKLPAFERLMIFAGLFSFGLLFYWCILTANFHYTFLIWNLLMAFVPYAISKKLLRAKHNSVASYLLLFSWLIFFPACIYPLTDLLQLKPTGDISVVYDAVMFLSFAIAGLLPGLISLKNVEVFLKKHTSGFFVKFSLMSFIFVSSYSACLLRFLHLKDWNIILDFKRIFYASKHSIVNPTDHFRVWIAIGLIVLIVDVLYAWFKKLTIKTVRIKF